VFHLLELLLGITEFLGEFGEFIAAPFRPGKRANPVLAGVGMILLGGVVGLGFALLVPHRLIATHRLPGLSMVLAPAAAGVVMGGYGAWRRRRGGRPPALATFWGGALFMFSAALVRWVIVAMD